MTDAAYGLPTELPAYLRPQRPYIRGTPLTARIDECSITPLGAPGAPKLIFVRGAVRGHEEGSVPFRLHLQQITMEFHEELWHIFTFTSSSSHKFAIDLDATSLHTLPGLRTFAICKEAHGQSALTWEGIAFRCLINMANSHTMFLPSILPGTRLQCTLRLCWYLPTLENTILRFRSFVLMRTCLTLPLATGWVTMATWCWKNGDVGAPSLRLNG